MIRHKNKICSKERFIIIALCFFSLLHISYVYRFGVQSPVWEHWQHLEVFTLFRDNILSFLQRIFTPFSGHMITTYFLIGSVTSLIPNYSFFAEMVFAVFTRSISCYIFFQILKKFQIELNYIKSLIIITVFFSLKGSEIILNGANLCVDISILFILLSFKHCDNQRKSLLYSSIAVLSHGIGLAATATHVVYSIYSKNIKVLIVWSVFSLVSLFLYSLEGTNSEPTLEKNFFDISRTFLLIFSVGVQPESQYLMLINTVYLFFFSYISLNLSTNYSFNFKQNKKILFILLTYSILLFIMIAISKNYPSGQSLNLGRNAYYSTLLTITLLTASSLISSRTLDFIFCLFIFLTSLFASFKTYQMVQANQAVRKSTDIALYQTCPNLSPSIFLGVVQSNTRIVEKGIPLLTRWHIDVKKSPLPFSNIKHRLEKISVYAKEKKYNDYDYISGIVAGSEPKLVFFAKNSDIQNLQCAITIFDGFGTTEFRLSIKNFKNKLTSQEDWYLYAVYRGYIDRYNIAVVEQ